MIVPAAALAAVAAAAGETAARELGRALGRSLGARVKTRLDVGGGSIDAALDELATELALVGLGTLSIERWGRALVLGVTDAPFSDPTGDALLASALEEMLSAATGREVHTMPLAREAAHLRVLVGKSESLERVHGWLSQGVSWGDALTRLHAPRTGQEGSS